MRQLTPLLFLALAACSWFGPDLPPVQRVAANAETQQSAAPQPGVPAEPPPPLPAAGAADNIPAFDTTRASIAGDVITVTVTDPLPVRGARLIAPDGAITEAAAIETERFTAHDESSTRPRIGANVVGGSGGGVSTGIGIGFPLFGAEESRTWRETQSRITFRLTDPAAYRAGWQRYTIAVDLDDGVNRRSFQMLPPAPPAP
jgi:predicted small lipoprotein YifL